MTLPLASHVTPDVTAVVVSWNTADLLADCLTSLSAHGPGDLTMATVVVDNASTDGSVALARSRAGVTVIANDKNVGFCRANNQAVRVTASPWLLLLNADAFLTPGCLDTLLARAATDDRIAVVAPRLAYGDGRWQRWTAGAAPGLASMAVFLSGADRLTGRLPFLSGHYLGTDRRDAFRPDWVSSACMLVRRTALEEVGLLDERIFVYMDDVDLCQRLRDACWQVWYEPAALTVHLMGQSTRRQTGRPSPEALRAFNRYFLRRHGVRRTRVLRGMQVVGFGARALAHAGLGLVRRDPAHWFATREHLSHLSLALESPQNRTEQL